MKKLFRILFLPFFWLWKFLTSGLTVLINLLILCSLIFSLLFVLGLRSSMEVRVPDQAVLLLNLKGSIVEERSPLSLLGKAFNQIADFPLNEEIFLQDLLDVIRAAAEDERVKVMLLDCDQLGTAGLDQLQSIGKALDAFREKGKQIIAMGDGFNQAQYYLAMRANAVYLHPMGAVNLRGFSSFHLYMRELFRKLDVNLHVFRAGTFKSAVEPLTRDSMSPEAREADLLWLSHLWDSYCADVAAYRKQPVETFKTNVSNMPAQLEKNGEGISEWALRTGLVDGLKTHDEVRRIVQALAGLPVSAPQEYKQIEFTRYLRTIRPSYSNPEGKDRLIAIVRASGPIIYGKGTSGQIGSEPLVARLQKARRNGRVKAIVLRINTGGGSAFASELIRQELLLAKAEGKTVVVSMGSVAASGGYWVASPADLIVASPVTLTGSIGIFGIIPTLERTLARIGVYGDGVGTTDIALYGKASTPMSEGEQKLLQIHIEQGYRQFLRIVAEGRKMSIPAVEKIAEGRVWDGKTAQELGLVDRLGGLHEAIAAAAELAHVPQENTWDIDAGEDSYLSRLKQAERAMETLFLHPASVFFPETASLAGMMRQARMEPLAFLLGARDPGGIYAHSLLPDAGMPLR